MAAGSLQPYDPDLKPLDRRDWVKSPQQADPTNILRASGPPATDPAAPTNLMAILALIFAFVFSPLGIVFGVMGRHEIQQTKQRGWALATWGMALGIAFTGIWVLIVLIYVILLAALM